MPHYTARHRNTPHYTTLHRHRTTPHYTTLHYTALHHTTRHYNTDTTPHYIHNGHLIPYLLLNHTSYCTALHHPTTHHVHYQASSLCRSDTTLISTGEDSKDLGKLTFK